MNLRDQILSAGRKTESVEVDEWGATVFAQELTAAKREEVLNFHQENIEKPLSAVCFTVVLGTVDENGDAVFEEGDIEELPNTVAEAPLMKLYEKIMAINGVDVSSKEDGETEGKPSESSETAQS